MPATPSQRQASYRHTAAALRNRILRGEWKPGQKLPTEQALCRTFGVSRITVRQALQILSDERLIYRRQGSGSFVSAHTTRRIPLLQAGFTRSIEQHAPEMTREVLTFARRHAKPDIAEQLQLPLGSRVLYARRVDQLDEKPVAFDDLYLPEVFADRLDLGDLEQVRFSPHWRQVQGLTFTHHRQQVEAVNASAAQARILAVPPRTALLKTTELIIESGGRPAGVFITHYLGNVFSLNSTTQTDMVSASSQPATLNERPAL